MALGVGFAQQAHALGQDWRNRRRERRIADALVDLEQDPEKTVARVRAIDPQMGLQLGEHIRQATRQERGDKMEMGNALSAQRRASQEQTMAAFREVTGLLRPIANSNGDVGAAYDSLMPVLANGLGMTPEEISQTRNILTQNPALLNEPEEDLIRVVGNSLVRVRGDQVEHLFEGQPTPQPDQVVTVRNPDGSSSVITVPRPRTAGGVVQQPGGGGGAAPSAAPDPQARAQYVSGIEDFVTSSGGRITGRARSEERNRQVGGVPNTYHSLEDDAARDLQPPPGVSHQEYAQQLGRQFPEYEFMAHRAVRPDGTRGALHVHGEPRPNSGFAFHANQQPTGRVMGGGTQEVYRTPPGNTNRNRWRTLSNQEAEALGLNTAARWQQSPTGQTQMIGPASQLPNPANVQRARSSFINTDQSLQRMERSVRTLMEHPGLERAAGWRSVFPSIPGGEAANFERDLENLKSQIGFEVINAMRQTSRTGGALGNVSNFEVDTLQRNIAALDLDQSPEQLRRNLTRVLEYADSLRGMFSQAYEQDTGRAPPSSRNRQQRAEPSRRAAPPEAIRMLRSNPSPARQRQFDEIFGAGAARRVLGRRSR